MIKEEGKFKWLEEGERGRPIILLHGLMGGVENFGEMVDFISAEYKVYGLDLKLFEGRTILKVSVKALSDYLYEFMSLLSIESAVLIGNSMGGHIGLIFAKDHPEKIVTVKMNLSESVSEEDIKKIIKPFVLSKKTQKQASNLIQSIYKVLLEKDASLIEINPLVLNKNEDLLCLDAKINFDDNALYRHPDIASLKDFNEEDLIETEASKHNLAYIKLKGKIGCMVNGAGLALI